MEKLFRTAPNTISLAAKPIIRSGKKFGLELTVVLLDDAPIFCGTHHRGRTEPCLRPLGHHCPDCEEGKAPRERAYIGCVHLSRRLRGVLELTAKAGMELAETKELRGRVVTLRRTHDKPNGSIIIEYQEHRFDNEQLPRFDTVEALMATWGVDLTPKLEQVDAAEAIRRGMDREDVWVGNGQAH